MISIHRTKHKLQRAVAITLLLPLLLVSLLPQGFMPAQTQEGWFTVTLCTADGLRTLTLDENGQEVPDPAGQPDDQTGNNHCLFGNFKLFEASAPADVLPVLDLQDAGNWPVSIVFSLPARYRQKPGARAPPFLA